MTQDTSNDVSWAVRQLCLALLVHRALVRCLAALLVVVVCRDVVCRSQLVPK
jgi:hypothetical protein